jgi:ubiquinone biosynthesis monooxygenase Coq7
MRHIDRVDQAIEIADRVLKFFTLPVRANRSIPKSTSDSSFLDDGDIDLSIELMRVNHCGEIMAQGLYWGQALTTQDPALMQWLLQAATEEQDHLAWCGQRLDELGGRRSFFDPLFFVFSFTLGALAGQFFSDQGLGLIEETEKQVSVHLQGHIDRLAITDHQTKAILNAMLADEQQHGQHANQLGAKPLDGWLIQAMQLGAKVMVAMTKRL